jgi:Ca-activated chloride channel family protein
VDELRYGGNPSQEGTARPSAESSDEYAFVKVRWKEPKGETSELLSVPVDRSVEATSIDQADESFRFAAAVAGFGEILKGRGNAGGMTIAKVEELAMGARGKDLAGVPSHQVVYPPSTQRDRSSISPQSPSKEPA